MSPGIFLIGEDGALTEMVEQAYESEDLLQTLLEDYPSILAGDQLTGSEPRRWLLISREAGVPSSADGGARWSIDHVFLDQSAIPTLVEVKRSADTRIRREVVGQMLDYAANAVVYWPVEHMQTTFVATCERRGVNPDEALQELLGGPVEQERFWADVRTNLQAGRIRMVFVADEIPAELQRIVEFLNQQMSSAEVLAIEIKQYLGGDRRTLVPRLIGQTAAAEQAKAAGRASGRQWNEDAFFADLAEKCGDEDVRLVREVLQSARLRFPRIVWGKGRTYGSFYPTLDHNTHSYFPFGVWSSGSVELLFQWLASRPPFDAEEKRDDLRRRLNEIPGLALGSEVLNRRPNFPLSVLADQTARKQFYSVLQWVADEAERT